jgi:hypothetical protein
VNAPISNSVSLNSWHEIILRYKQSENNLYVTLDGVTTVLTAALAPTTSTASFTLGALPSGVYKFLGRLDSWIKADSSFGDDAVAWFRNNGKGRDPRELTDSQIAEWNVVAGWPLDEESGTRYDAIGTHHLCDVGGVGVGEGHVLHLGNVGAVVSAIQSGDKNKILVSQNEWMRRGRLFTHGLKLDGVDNYYTGTLAVPVSEFMLYIVADDPESTVNQCHFEIGLATNHHSIFMREGTDLCARRISSNLGSVDTRFAAAGDGERHIYAVEFSNARGVIWRDGVQVAINESPITLTSSTAFSIGRLISEDTYYSSSTYSAIGLYSGVHTDAQRQGIQKLLSRLTGVPLS